MTKKKNDDDNIIRPAAFDPCCITDYHLKPIFYDRVCRHCGTPIKVTQEQIDSNSPYRLLCVGCIFQAGFDDGILNDPYDEEDDSGEHL